MTVRGGGAGGGRDGSKEDTKDAEFDLTRGIRISVSEIFVCSVVTLLHGGSSCRFDSLYLNLRTCNIFVTKVGIYMYIHLTK